MSCDKSLKGQHCAFKFRWAIIITGFIAATAAMFFEKNIQANWVYTFCAAAGIGGLADFSLYRIKKNGHNGKG